MAVVFYLFCTLLLFQSSMDWRGLGDSYALGLGRLPMDERSLVLVRRQIEGLLGYSEHSRPFHRCRRREASIIGFLGCEEFLVRAVVVYLSPRPLSFHR